NARSVTASLHPPVRLDRFGLPLLSTSTGHPGVPGNFAGAPVFTSLNPCLGKAVAMYAGGWLADTATQASAFLPYVDDALLDAGLEVWIGAAKGRSARAIRHWRSPAALRNVSFEDPAMSKPAIAIAWARTGDNRALLVSAGYLIRLVQIGIYLNGGHLTGPALHALCRFNLATLASACDRTELLDWIKAALDS